MAEDSGAVVISRKFQESIKIGDDITITIVRISADSVRIGVEAPPDVRVDRSEIGTLRQFEKGVSDDVPPRRKSVRHRRR